MKAITSRCFIPFQSVRYVCGCGSAHPRGRVDVVMRSLSALYVMELKLGKTADDAMGQIDLKNYPERFALCGLPVVKVGINFDSERRTLGEWKIEMA